MTFPGVAVDELQKVEKTFNTNINVWELVPDPEEKLTAKLTRRSTSAYPDTMTLNLYERHFSFIQTLNVYCKSYKCSECGNTFTRKNSLLRHKRTLHAKKR